MRGIASRLTLFGALAALLVTAGSPSAFAIHLYRGPGGGCTPADGAITDDADGRDGPVGPTVVIGHFNFSAGIAGTGFDPTTNITPTETHVKAGQAVKWTWNSSHCHSVTSVAMNGTQRLFDSGFHYPTTPPESPQVAPGVFDYPILDDTPTLSYTHTFTTPGTYAYFCVHHTTVGMNGVIVVDPA